MTSPDPMPAAPVLGYRGPGAPVGTALNAIVAALRLREQLFFIKVLVMLLAGVPLSFLGPFIAAAAVVALSRDVNREPTVSFGVAMCLCSLSLAPLLYWYERRTRGQYFMDALRDWASNGGASRASSYSEFEYNYTAGAWILWIEIFLFGPRMTMQACQHLRERSRLRHVSPRQAAEVLVSLLRLEHGISAAELAAKTDDIRGTLDGVLYLVFHDWAALSKDRTRVWALTDSRRRFGDLTRA